MKYLDNQEISKVSKLKPNLILLNTAPRFTENPIMLQILPVSASDSESSSSSSSLEQLDSSFFPSSSSSTFSCSRDSIRDAFFSGSIISVSLLWKENSFQMIKNTKDQKTSIFLRSTKSDKYVYGPHANSFITITKQYFTYFLKVFCDWLLSILAVDSISGDFFSRFSVCSFIKVIQRKIRLLK